MRKSVVPLRLNGNEVRLQVERSQLKNRPTFSTKKPTVFHGKGRRIFTPFINYFRLTQRLCHGTYPQVFQWPARWNHHFHQPSRAGLLWIDPIESSSSLDYHYNSNLTRMMIL